PALEDRQADHHRLRDAVEHGSEHDRERRAVFLSAFGLLTVSSAGAVDPPVAAKYDAAADEDARNDRTVTGRDVGGLLDQIERDRANQHTRAEAHDEPNCGEADSEEQTEQRSAHE